MNTLLKRTLLKSALLLPLVLAPVLTLAAEHGNRDHGGERQSQHDNRGNDRGRDNFRGNDRRDHGNVRLNIGIGAFPRYGYSSPFDSWSYGIGYSPFGSQYYLNGGYPYGGWGYNSRPVIIERNTYIEQPSTRVYTNRTNETSLLRDLNGRCYERTYDRDGNEIRTELDPGECDF